MEAMNQDLFRDQAVEQEPGIRLSGASPTGATCTFTGAAPPVAVDVDGDPGA